MNFFRRYPIYICGLLTFTSTIVAVVFFVFTSGFLFGLVCSVISLVFSVFGLHSLSRHPVDGTWRDVLPVVFYIGILPVLYGVFTILSAIKEIGEIG